MDPSVVKPFPQWWLDWHYSLRSKPWRIVVSNISYEKENARFEAGQVDPRDHRCIVDEPLQRDDPFSIWLIPEGPRREEYFFCLIYEKLTVESALKLTKTSHFIKDALQIDTVESLCVMAQIFVALEVWISEQVGKRSVLTFGAANSDDNPGYPLQEFLRCWDTVGTRLIGGLRTGKFKGKVTYATIPPRIISLPKPPSDRLPSDVGMPLEFITSLVDERVEAGLLRQAKVLLAPKEAKATKALLPTIEASSWNEVHIAFVSNDSIRIRSGNRDKTFSYAELGFKDGRKVDTPNSHWIVFHTLAECGEISWKIDVDQKTRNQAQKAIQAIRKTLKEITGLDDDPFENYQKVKAYRPKFKLVDKSYGGTGMLLSQANQENEEDDSDPEIQALMDEDINR